MKRLISVCVLVTLAFLTSGCGNANADRVNSWIAYKYPGSVQLGVFGEWNRDYMEIHVVCQSGKLTLVEINKAAGSADIMGQFALPADRASCK